MKNIFLSAITLITLGMAATEADARFYVIKDGKIEGWPDSVAFEKPDKLPEAVDLGLSVKWASFNIGASAPEEYGDYFAWGEVETKEVYNWSTYKWVKEGGDSWKDVNKYTYADGLKNGTNWYYGNTFVGDNNKELDDEDDVAVQLLGGDWQMPTFEEWQELIDNCTWTWTTENGVNGYKVTSKKEGYTDKSIFLPAAGSRDDADFYDAAGSYGGYWSRSIDLYGSNSARSLGFGFGGASAYDRYERSYGLSVRAVQHKD